MVAERFPQAGLIPCTENRGYSAGNNRAMRQLGFGESGTPPVHLPRYLLLLVGAHQAGRQRRQLEWATAPPNPQRSTGW